MIFGQNLGRQTEKAKQGILRYIWDRKLKAGDKIPGSGRVEPPPRLGCATLDRAVKSLVQDGVLESRRRVGVFVRNASPEGAAGPVDRRGRAAARHAAHVQLEHGLRPSERTAEERLPVYDVPRSATVTGNTRSFPISRASNTRSARAGCTG